MTKQFKRAWNWSPAAMVLGICLLSIWAFAVWSQQQNFPGGSGSGTVTISFNGQASVYPAAFPGWNGNAHKQTGCTTVATTPNVTCANASFLTTAVAGQTIFATNNCAAGGSITTILAETTILSVTSNTQLVTTANATTSETGTACVTWGTLDQNQTNTGVWTTICNTVDTLLTAGYSVTLNLPNAGSLVEGPVCISAYTSQTGHPVVQGPMTFYGTPSFKWTSCNPACFFYPQTNQSDNQVPYIIKNVTFDGSGLTAAGVCPASLKYLLQMWTPSLLDTVNVFDWCNPVGPTGNLIPIYVSSYGVVRTSTLDYAGNYSPGSIAGETLIVGLQAAPAGGPVNLYNVNDLNSGMIYVSTTNASPNTPAIFNTYGGNYQDACTSIYFSHANIVGNLYGDNSGGMSVAGMGSQDIVNIYGGTQWSNNCGNTPTDIDFGSSGATVAVYGTNLSLTNSANFLITGTSGNLVLSGLEYLCPVSTCTGEGAFSNPAINVSVPRASVSGSCSGVATASSTLGLYGTGPNATTTTCTSTTIGTGNVATRAGTITNFICRASAGGVNASSGACTVVKNGTPQTMTCTIGTGTSCSTTANPVSYVVNDRISIQFTSQLADTLAGVNAVAWPVF